MIKNQKTDEIDNFNLKKSTKLGLTQENIEYNFVRKIQKINENLLGLKIENS